MRRHWPLAVAATLAAVIAADVYLVTVGIITVAHGLGWYAA